MRVNSFNSGDTVKKYRRLLKISQKEAAANRMSHSMVSLIESGKIQLTTVTAMILADNFNKIAAGKGIELNLSLKDLLSRDNCYVEENIRNSFKEALMKNSSEEEFFTIFEYAREHNCFEIMAEVKEAIGMASEKKEKYNYAIDYYGKAFEYYNLTQNNKKAVEVVISIARCYNRLKEYHKAEEYIENLRNEILGKYSDDQIIFDINFELLHIMVNSKRIVEALQIIENMLKNKKINATQKRELLLLKVNIYIDEKKYNEGIYILKKLLSTNHDSDYLIAHKLAVAYLLMGSKEDGMTYMNQCITILGKNPRCENTKVTLKLADELKSNELTKYSVNYYEYALSNSELYNEKDNGLICHKALFDILNSEENIRYFEKYASKIENFIISDNKVENFTQYLLLLVKYYLKTAQHTKLQRFIEMLEVAI